MKANTVTKITVTDELLLIQEQNKGLLDPVKVVEFARDKTTALHGRFEWDDSEAAERYRIWQARSIIRLEFIVIPSKNNKDTIVRSFVSLIADRRAEKDRGYRLMLDVLSDEDLRKQMLDEAKTDMLIFRRKYGHLKELDEVFRAMDKV